jgi:SAM-dependent methyltransferase
LAYYDRHEQPGYWRDVTRHFRQEMRLLDIGCGTAWLAEHFSRYTGIERSPDTVRIARALGRNVVDHDLEDGPLPFDDAAFDGAVLKDVLEHVNDPAAVVREVFRVLADGGLVLASSPDAQRSAWHDYTHVRPFTRRAYRDLFADQGFDVTRVGYESIMRGIDHVSALTRRKRRPRTLGALAWLPIVPRNVWLLARRPPRPAAARASGS